MTSTVATVRPATPSDAEGIARVHIASWQVAYRGQVPDAYLDGLAAEVARRTDFWRRWISEGRVHVFVSELEGFVTGFVSCGRSDEGGPGDPIGEVYAIYVHPQVWGSGTGRALFERARATLRELGFTKATLWVLGSNERARRFYEAAGWVADGATKEEERGTFVLREVRYRRDPL